MPDSFSSRTVAIVALASLVAGFVAVFAGGLMLMGPGSAVVPTPAADAGSAPPEVVDAGAAASGPADDAAAAPDPGPTAATDPGESAAPTPTPAAGSVRFSPSVVSRCWDANNPAIVAGAACDRLAGLEAHFASKAADIAACARGHGRLAFIMDFRFSTAFVRSWGGPSSTIGDAGSVVACVRRVTQPLPLATVTHAHDRYLMVLPIDW